MLLLSHLQQKKNIDIKSAACSLCSVLTPPFLTTLSFSLCSAAVFAEVGGVPVPGSTGDLLLRAVGQSGVSRRIDTLQLDAPHGPYHLRGQPVLKVKMQKYGKGEEGMEN